MSEHRGQSFGLSITKALDLYFTTAREGECEVVAAVDTPGDNVVVNGKELVNTLRGVVLSTSTEGLGGHGAEEGDVE